MKASEILSMMERIKEEYGDIEVKIQIDPRQPGVGMDNNTFFDEITLIKMGPEDKYVILSNVFIKYYEAKGISGVITYDPDTKLYNGKLNTNIEGFTGTFYATNPQQAVLNFNNCVDEYLDFMKNAQIINANNLVVKTNKVVNNIIEREKDIDLDYGEIGPNSIVDNTEDEDEDYGELTNETK